MGSTARIPLPGVRKRGRRPAAVGGVGPLGLGVAGLWLSVIVLLPLAAVATRSLDNGAGGLWDGVSAPAARAALVLTVGVSLVVAVINVVAGTLVAWVLVRDEFLGQAIRQRAHRPAVRPPDDGREHRAARPLRPAQPHRPGSLCHAAGARDRAGVRDAAVRGALGAARPHRGRPRGRAGGGVARRRQLDDLPPPHPAVARPGAARRRRPVVRARDRGVRPVVLIGGGIPHKTEVASQYIAMQIEIDRPVNAAAVSMTLLAISLLVLLVLRVIATRSRRHEAR